MKHTTIPLLLLILSLFGCFSRDDDDIYLRNVEISDAFSFENEKNYVVGDTIYFDLSFSRYVKEEGYSNLLDIYETTGAEEFFYAFQFSKFSDFSNTYLPINVAERFVFAEKGEVSGQGNNVKAVLNQNRNMYESRIGIVLAEAGNFSFEMDNYSFNLYPVEVPEDKVFFEIWHRFTDLDVERFRFTVAEP